jgi:adenylate cyclase
MTGFLGFVVNETLYGRADRIKQYTIATKVFDRDSDFNQQIDPIVRVQAAKIRRALHRYYLEEGHDDPVRIDIPKGTYVPTFAEQSGSTNATTRASVQNRRLPTVAIMPFSNKTGDPSQDFLASGFAEDLSTELSRFQGIAVVAYFSTQQCRQCERDVCNLGRDLNADFLVTGSFRQVEPELRVNSQVYCTSSGTQIWAERFRRRKTAAELYDVQDEILQSITAQVAGTYGAIGDATAKSTSRKEHASLSGYEAVLRALHFDKTMASDDYADAMGALRSAVKSDPSYVSAWARLAILELDSVGFGFDLGGDGLQRGSGHAERAVAMNPNNQDAQFAMAWASLLRSDVEGTVQSAWRMIELNPGDASLVGTGGWFLALAGERTKGMEIIEHSRGLNPNCPSWFHLIPFLEHFDQGDYDDALREANQIGLPEFFWDPLLKAATLGHLGRSGEAANSLRRLIALQPDFEERADSYVGCLVLSEKLRKSILDGLSNAGLNIATVAQ